MLILCEKPSVAAEFSKVLECKSDKGCFRSDRIIITYCLGHLFELYMPEDYDPKLKKWEIGALPIIPPIYKYKKNVNTEGQANIVLSLLKEHINDDILIATDAGREGELIARIVLRQAGIKDISRCRRFWVSEALTKDVIIQGIKNARTLSEYNVIARQGYARQQADWLLGINISRYVSIGNTETFPVGRVITAVVSAITLRNYQTRNFIPTPYQELEITLADDNENTIKAKLYNNEQKSVSFTPKSAYLLAAMQYAKNNSNQIKIISSIKKKAEKPEKLYNITGLEKDSFKIFGYKPEKTLEIAQTLYEKYKILSYPRTPSRVMGDNNIDLFIEKYELLESEYPQWSSFSDKNLISADNKHIFNSAALEDHHALIPLGLPNNQLSEEERNVYELVVRRFFTACMNDYLYNEVAYLIFNGDYRYRATVRQIMDEGWKKSVKLQDTEYEKEQEINSFNDQKCKIRDVNILDKMSKPKQEYSIDTLLSFMENPKAEEEISEYGKLYGLGTPATRAEIIKNIFQYGYVTEIKKKLFVTKKGLYLVNLLRQDEELKKIQDITYTTDWERQLEKNPEAFIENIVRYIKVCIKNGIDSKYEKQPVGICPVCGNKILEGKKAWYCESYKNNTPCVFSISKEIAGAEISENDVHLILSKKMTRPKTCVSKKTGNKFKASFRLDDNNKIEFVFSNNKGIKK